jgi:Fic-DOC domain mobile mystery protein B
LRLPVLTRDELNLAEAQNIGRAAAWLFLTGRRLRPEAVIEEAWLKRLHQRMYGQVWNWAGQYRTSDRNLGVPYWQVRIGMRNVNDDVSAWLADTSGSQYPTNECAIRFGHRLVVIHPFPDGNGRWSRMASDALVVALGGSRFTWGGASLMRAGSRRHEYIAALQTADASGDFEPLMRFARS